MLPSRYYDLRLWNIQSESQSIILDETWNITVGGSGIRQCSGDAGIVPDFDLALHWPIVTFAHILGQSDRTNKRADSTRDCMPDPGCRHIASREDQRGKEAGRMGHLINCHIHISQASAGILT